MPLVLMQRAWRDDPLYKDTEFVVYHYPRRYFDEIRGGEQFVYYRPARGAARGEESRYFGCGQLGDVYSDPQDDNHRFVDVRKPVRFAHAVSFEDPSGRMYESRYPNRSAFQGYSVRFIDELDFYRILSAAGLVGSVLAEDVAWVSEILQGNSVALVTRDANDLQPVNELARKLPIFL